jgi:hypothetical protein
MQNAKAGCRGARYETISRCQQTARSADRADIHVAAAASEAMNVRQRSVDHRVKIPSRPAEQARAEHGLGNQRVETATSTPALNR